MPSGVTTRILRVEHVDRHWGMSPDLVRSITKKPSSSMMSAGPTRSLAPVDGNVVGRLGSDCGGVVSTGWEEAGGSTLDGVVGGAVVDDSLIVVDVGGGGGGRIG